MLETRWPAKRVNDKQQANYPQLRADRGQASDDLLGLCICREQETQVSNFLSFQDTATDLCGDKSSRGIFLKWYLLNRF